MFSVIKKYLASSLLLLLLCSLTIYHIYKIQFPDITNEDEYYTTPRLPTTKTTTAIIEQKDDISCHDKTEGDALPSVEEISFAPPDNSIFFHETSCREWLNSRQACAVESAAKSHPERKVYVLFSAPITENVLFLTRSSLLELKSYPNIEYARVYVREYAKGTPLEELFHKRIISRSKWKVVHTSDLIRVITMFKYGGLFLDTDIIVMKPMDSLGRNWLGKESDDEISSAALNVAKDELGQEIVSKVLEEISTSYMPNEWLYNGPEALRRVLGNFCNTTDVEKFSKTTCRGFQFYDPEVIYPVPWYDFQQLFKPGRLPSAEDAYTFHFWNQLSSNLEVQRKSPIDKLAEIHCPIIHKLYGDSFGW